MNNIIRRYKIIGLHYYQNFEIEFNEPVRILVGENGLGKTTVLNSLYYLLTCRWHALLNIGFDFIELYIKKYKIEFSRSELEAYVYDLSNSLKSSNIEVVDKFQRINSILKKDIANKVIYFPVNRNIENYMMNLGIKLSSNEISDILNSHHKEANESKTITTKWVNEIKEVINDTIIKSNFQDIEGKLTSSYSSEASLRSFMAVCNSYLIFTEFYLDKKSHNLAIRNKKTKEVVELIQLSSGEKQIIYIFSKVYLSKEKGLIVLFDEPELSLSLIWQKRLLPDVVNSKKCSFLFAVTHSPFIFKNELDSYAIGMNVYID